MSYKHSIQYYKVHLLLFITLKLYILTISMMVTDIKNKYN